MRDGLAAMGAAFHPRGRTRHKKSVLPLFLDKIGEYQMHIDGQEGNFPVLNCCLGGRR